MAWRRQIPHQLLPLLAVSFMLGITLARCAAETPLPWAMPAALGGVALVLLALRRSPPDRAILACLPLFCCAGFIHGHVALERPERPGRIGAFLAESADATGRVRTTLAGRILGMVEYDGAISRCAMAVEWALPLPEDAATEHPITDTQKIQKISGRVALRVRGPLPDDIQPGAFALALGRIERAKDPAGHDDAVLWLKSPEALKSLPAAPPAFLDRVRFGPERLRGCTARFLQTHLPPDIAGAYQALLIGSRQGIAPETLEHFKISGCMHILAISGLHVGLVAAMAGALLYRLLARSTRLLLSGRAKIWALALTAPIIAFYAALAGLGAPVLRALVMALLALVALMLCRRRALPHLVAGAALLLLALQPRALFTAAFQLSFAAAAAIALILPRLPWFALAAERRGRERLRAALLSMLLVSVAATLGTLPIMLWHFNRVSLIGPLMNLLVEPLLCLWALPLGLIALALAGFVPPLAVALLHLGGLGIRAALWLMAAASHLPLAAVWSITPNLVEIVFYFVMLALALAGSRRARLSACVIAAALALSFSAPWWRNDGPHEARVSFIDVGQGASVLVELPQGRHLIDCGGFFQRDYEVGSRKAAPFLWRRRIPRLDAVLVSHADSDHYSGMAFILERFRPRRLYVNAGDKADAAYEALLARAAALGVEVRRVAGRETMAAGAGFALDCYGVSPEEAATLGENDRSLLARMTFGRRVFLFPGDIAEARERLLLRDPQNIRADVLMAGHHGSIGSTTPPFLAAVAPKAIVVSAGASRRGTHPAPEHLARWRDAGIAVFSTAELGDIEARTDGERLCLRGKGKEQCRE